MNIPIKFMQTNITLPRPLTALDEDSFFEYLEWQQARNDLATLNSYFRKTLADSTGFSDENLPEEPLITKESAYGSLKFKIEGKKGTKKPKYGEIFKSFSTYLDELQRSYGQGTLRKNYRTEEVDNKRVVYVTLDMILNRLQTDVETMIAEKEGMSFGISLLEPEELQTSIPSLISIVSGTNYAAPSEYNARIYQEAKNLKEQGDINTGFNAKAEGKFKQLLMEDSFNRLGEKPEVTVSIPYPFGSITFKHQIKPESTAKYETIINGFLKPIPDTIRKGITIGDFVMLQQLNSDLETTLKEKGIWTDSFEQAYQPKIIDGQVYILLEGPFQRLQQFKDKATSLTYNQSVSIGRTRT